ncbi:MAG: hypothetical protein LUE92_07790 [Clostridiales bacterium]|nr:hypothetical protein [Clostridiales bacterium]
MKAQNVVVAFSALCLASGIVCLHVEGSDVFAVGIARATKEPVSRMSASGCSSQYKFAAAAWTDHLPL